MRALVLEGPLLTAVRDVSVPGLAAGEVLVRIERAGLCGSDLAVFSGERPAQYPLIMGHEAVGRIADAGDNRRAVGTRVVIEPNIPCGECRVCRRGHGNVCPSKRSLGMNWPGVFAEYVGAPAAFTHPLADDIDLDDAVGIEPLAVALHAVRASGVQAGEPVAVVGCGAEGLLLVQVAAARGARVLAADLHQDQLDVASRLGAEHVALVPGDAARIAREWCPSVVFEAAGVPSALELALGSVAPGGRVVAVGLGAEPVPLVPLDFVRRGLTLTASLIYEHPADFLQAIELVRLGQMRPSRLVARVVQGLDALPDALAATAIDRTHKTVVAIA